MSLKLFAVAIASASLPPPSPAFSAASPLPLPLRRQNHRRPHRGPHRQHVFCGAATTAAKLMTTGHDALLACKFDGGTYHGVDLKGVRAFAKRLLRPKT